MITILLNTHIDRSGVVWEDGVGLVGHVVLQVQMEILAQPVQIARGQIGGDLQVSIAVDHGTKGRVNPASRHWY